MGRAPGDDEPDSAYCRQCERTDNHTIVPCSHGLHTRSDEAHSKIGRPVRGVSIGFKSGLKRLPTWDDYNPAHVESGRLETFRAAVSFSLRLRIEQGRAKLSVFLFLFLSNLISGTPPMGRPSLFPEAAGC